MEAIEARRRELGLSQDWLRHRAGISTGTYTRLACGARQLKPDERERLLAVLAGAAERLGDGPRPTRRLPRNLVALGADPWEGMPRPNRLEVE